MTQLKPKKVNILVSQIFYLIFSLFLSNLIKLHFTEFHSLSKENFENKSYVLPLYLMEN